MFKIIAKFAAGSIISFALFSHALAFQPPKVPVGGPGKVVVRPNNTVNPNTGWPSGCTHCSTGSLKTNAAVGTPKQ
jgi:hypothetical protein